MSLIEQLKNEGVLEGYWDFRSGSYRDWSGNNIDMTPSGSPTINRNGVQLNGVDQEMSGGSMGALNAGLTVIAFADLKSTVGFGGFISKATGGTDGNFYFRQDDGVLEAYWRNADDSSNRQIDSVAGGAEAGLHCYGFTHTFGSTADTDFYKDGISVGVGTAINTDLPLTTETTINIGVRDPGDQPMDGTMVACLVVSRVMTASEMAKIVALHIILNDKLRTVSICHINIAVGSNGGFCRFIRISFVVDI